MSVEVPIPMGPIGRNNPASQSQSSVADQLTKGPVIVNESKCQRCWLLTKFFVSNVLLVFFDIGSDIWAACSYFERGDTWWGTCTTLLIFAPMAAKIVLTLFHLRECYFRILPDKSKAWYQRIKRDRNEARIAVQSQEAKKLIWHFPLLHPIRNLRLFIGLYLMDTSLAQNSSLIDIIQKEALGMGILEAFLESAPQFILQCSIILRTGNIAIIQFASIPLSYLSLMLASIKLFSSQRLGRHSDPDPPVSMMIVVGLFIGLLLAGPLTSVILLASYYLGYVAIIIFAIIVINFLLFKFAYFRKKQFPDLVQMYKRGRNHVKWMDEDRGKKDFLLISITSAATAWVSPCVPWLNLNTYYLLRSSYTSLFCHFLAITSLYFAIHNASMLDAENPPLIHCFPSNHIFNSSEYEEFNIFKSSICSVDNCLSKIRICPEEQVPTYLLFKVFLPFAYSLLLISFAASTCLQYLVDFENLHFLSKCFFCCCNPNIHFSLLHDILWEHDPEKSKDLTQKQKSLFTKAIEINKPIINIREPLHGHTCLHAAFDAQLFSFLKYLIQNGGNIDIRNRYECSVRDLIEQKQKNDKPEDPQIMQELLDASKTHSTSPTSENKQTMHFHANHENFGWMCFYHILGGQWGTHDADEELIGLILKKITKNEKNLDNSFVKLILMNAFEPFYGNTLLHYAALQGMTDSVEILLRHNFSITSRTTTNGRTPLHSAILMGKQDCAELLIKKGSNVNELDFCKNTPLHIAASNQSSSLAKLLIDSNALVNASTRAGNTPLHLAVKASSAECTDLLLHHGAQVNATDKHGNTPLHLAAKASSPECTNLLLQQGAQVDAINIDGHTALQLAVKASSPECTDLLLHHGAKVNATDNNGKALVVDTTTKNAIKPLNGIQGAEPGEENKEEEAKEEDEEQNLPLLDNPKRAIFQN